MIVKEEIANIKDLEFHGDSISRLKTLREYFAADLSSIHLLMIECKDHGSTFVNTMLGHIVLSSGKRVRPLSTIILGYALKAGNYDIDKTKLHRLSASFEILHTATILHDDVIDNGRMRRKNATVNANWGDKSAILAGDLLLAQSLEWLVDIGMIDLIQIIVEHTKQMIHGELHNLNPKKSLETQEEQYIETITNKTATLFMAYFGATAKLANGGQLLFELLVNFGRNFGIAYQIIDDMLDYTTIPEPQKDVANDFDNKKITLPIIYILKNCSESEKYFVMSAFKRQKNKDSLPLILNLIHRYNALAYCKSKAKSYCDLAKQDLNRIQDYIAQKQLSADNILKMQDYMLGAEILLEIILNRNV